MPDTAATQKCAHPQCHCQVATGQQYCSESCKTASDWEPCQCGHDACMSETAAENVG